MWPRFPGDCWTPHGKLWFNSLLALLVCTAFLYLFNCLYLETRVFLSFYLSVSLPSSAGRGVNERLPGASLLAGVKLWNPKTLKFWRSHSLSKTSVENSHPGLVYLQNCMSFMLQILQYLLVSVISIQTFLFEFCYPQARCKVDNRFNYSTEK